MRRIILQPFVNLELHIENNYRIIDVSFVNSTELLLLAQEIKKMENNNSDSYDNLLPNYKIHIISNAECTQLFEIRNSEVNLHYIRSFKNGTICIVGARCEYISEDIIEKNALIYTRNGNLLNQMIFGDGIANIKIDENNNIWISYFDEGVYGNNGWVQPFGNMGLLYLNYNGELQYEYKPEKPHKFIDDCYALTIDSKNDIWFYYYSEFVLCKYSNGNLTYYKPHASGSSCLLIGNRSILMDEGYGKHNQYGIFDKETLNEIDEIILVNENDEQISNSLKYYEDSRGILLTENKIYIFDLCTIE